MIWYDYEEYDNEEEKYSNEKEEELLLFDSEKVVKKNTYNWSYDPDFGRWAAELRGLEILVDLFP